MLQTRIASRGNVLRDLGILLCFLVISEIRIGSCNAFQNYAWSPNRKPSIRQDTSRNVLAEPPKGVGSTEWRERPRKKRIIRTKRKNQQERKEEVFSSGRWDKAVLVESNIRDALDALQESLKLNAKAGTVLDRYPLQFPGIRDCNAALASFGDADDLLRALRLYFKMRKVAGITESNPPKKMQAVPAPTLVTFSTLMSRAMYAGKPMVAIRLWNMMKQEPNFFTSKSSASSSSRIIPDVKSANILMNAYAKLGEIHLAQDLLQQMIEGGGKDVPKTEPNIVTYNTLLDACHNAGELDIALRVKDQLDNANLRPDARTFTTLIATVARKAQAASGAKDPTLAFSLLKEMKSRRIRPNGMTYSALIDACGRCERSDLALKGLRLLLDQKSREQARQPAQIRDDYKLPAEVGAWTAAIHACGKSGSIDTAVKLFYSMPKYGVYPNTITCGSLVDCLLRNGRTSDSLNVLRYMKKNRIAPSEVMYTSLMTSASKLAEYENQILGGDEVDQDATTAVEVYAELMASVAQAPKAKFDQQNNSHKKADPNDLFRVSLIFQEMKSAGVEPDLACYNAILKACAKGGDVDKAVDVLDQINSSDELEPNEQTWNSVIRAAGKAGRSDVALWAWKNAVEDVLDDDGEPRNSRKRHLSDRSLGALVSALVQNAEDVDIDRNTEVRLYQLVVKIWESILSQSEFLGMHLVQRNRIYENKQIMGTFLHSVVSLESFVAAENANAKIDRAKLRKSAISMSQFNCFEGGLSKLRGNVPVATAFQAAQRWAKEGQS
ncbi:unnamed protein product [Cylindrotheca closterium]|uniref:Pentacotripeptide-repeat region of PRORP domain-containing protein n=1 Tax=Cylindrotheca closterium TaxID=2856 RepID=A0AAD2G6W0_9STRA|nr:unnamed protein product [Cylindrotheca closterium]